MNSKAFVLALRKRAADLVRAADLIDALDIADLKSVMECMTLPVTVTTSFTPSVPPGEPHIIDMDGTTKKDIPIRPRRTLTTRGMRANILRHLATGATDCGTLAGVLNIAFHKVKACLVQLIHNELVRTYNLDRRGSLIPMYILTAKGDDEADFFIRNPKLMIRNQQAVKNRQGKNG